MTATRAAPPGLGHVPHSGAEDWWRSWLVRTSAAPLGTLVFALALVAAFVEYWPSRRRGTCQSG